MFNDDNKNSAVDISKYPTIVTETLDDIKKKVTIYDDMHANPINLMYCLIKDGYAETDENTYLKLYEVYNNWNQETTNEQQKKRIEEEYNECIEKINFVPGSKFILTCGGLGGYGKNDLLILKLYEKIQQDHCTCVKILGNQDANTLSNMNFDRNVKNQINEENQIKELDKALDDKRITKERHDELVAGYNELVARRNRLVKDAVFPGPKLIDYTIDEGDKESKKINIIMHDLNSFDIIQQLAVSLKVTEYKTDNAVNTGKTIDKINEKFQSLFSENEAAAKKFLEEMNKQSKSSPLPLFVQRIIHASDPSINKTIENYILFQTTKSQKDIINGYINEIQSEAEDIGEIRMLKMSTQMNKGHNDTESRISVLKSKLNEAKTNKDNKLISDINASIETLEQLDYAYIDASREITTKLSAWYLSRAQENQVEKDKRTKNKTDLDATYESQLKQQEDDNIRLEINSYMHEILSKGGITNDITENITTKIIEPVKKYITDARNLKLNFTKLEKTIFQEKGDVITRKIEALEQRIVNYNRVLQQAQIIIKESPNKDELRTLCALQLEDTIDCFGIVNEYMHEMRYGIDKRNAEIIIKVLKAIITNTENFMYMLTRLNEKTITPQDDKLISDTKTSIEASERFLVGCNLALREAEAIAKKGDIDNKSHKCSTPGWMKFKAVMKGIGLILAEAIKVFKANVPKEKVKKAIEAAKKATKTEINLIKTDFKMK